MGSPWKFMNHTLGYTYFCPRCGMGFEAGGKRERFKLAKSECPQCGVRGRMSGWLLMVLGLLTAVLIDTCPEVAIIGLVIGVPLIVVGVIRMAQQEVTRWRYRRQKKESVKGTDSVSG